MKLLVCFKCNDVISLSTEGRRHCRCKASSGGYDADFLNAYYSGPSLLLGFANGSFTQALRDQLIKGDDGLESMGGFGVYADQLKGRDFTAFVIPEGASSIRREDERLSFEEIIELVKKS